ncbi:MAG: ferrochelatase [Actinomycetota bacterium]|nr:ferrochelatase [Actinomycetota bacterium]
MSYDSILLASFGGPEGPDDVIPFLERVTQGRAIPPERIAEVSQRYLRFGGISPINQQNRELMNALHHELMDRGIDLPIYWGNRNWDPDFTDAIRTLDEDGRSKVLAIATSAYPSYSGCRQYRENIAAALQEAETPNITVDMAFPYSNRHGFTAHVIEVLSNALVFLVNDNHLETAIDVLFTTHSLPKSSADTSGPAPHTTPGLYIEQHETAIAEVMRVVGIATGLKPRSRLVFQSRSGAPGTPWLEPDVNDALHEIAAAGQTTAVVLVPIGFVSDHMEVMWDLDNEAMATAEELNLACVRIPTPGVSPAFVSALADVIEDARLGEPTRTDLIGLCSGTCCPNPRSELPAIPGV